MFKSKIIKYALTPFFCLLIAIPSNTSDAPVTREIALNQVVALRATTFANITIQKSHENKLVLQTTHSQLKNLQENYNGNELILTGNGSQNSSSSSWTCCCFGFSWSSSTVLSNKSAPAHYTLYLKNPEQLRIISCGGSSTCIVLPAIGHSSDATEVSCAGSGGLNIQEVRGSSVSLMCSGSGNIGLASCKTLNLTTNCSENGDISVNCSGGSLRVALKCSGSGDIVLQGTVESVEGSVSGSGDVNLRSLVVLNKNIDIKKSGSGSVKRPSIS